MSSEAWIVVIIIAVAFFLFVWEKISADLVAMLIMISLVLTGVLNINEAVSGFSNPATLTVAFMFVISAAVLRTGVMELWGPKFSGILQKSYRKGMLAMMLAVALCSAFINNTPVVAIFIPVILQVSKSTGIPASKMLIPLSFASILGGMCTLIGTSTNILVSGMLEDAGYDAIGMFEMAPVAVVLAIGGALYFYFLGFRQLPIRGNVSKREDRMEAQDYISEIQLSVGHPALGKKIMHADFLRELDIDIIEIHRGEEVHTLPSGDMYLQEGDLLKISCAADQLNELKSASHVELVDKEEISDDKHTSLVELVVPPQSKLEGKSLKDLDFRRTFRAVPLAIRQRSELVNHRLHDVTIQAGDVILAQMKTHYAKQLKSKRNKSGDPFILLSEKNLVSYDKKSFRMVISILFAMIAAAAFGVPMLLAALSAVSLLALTKRIKMKDMYSSVSWNIIFLMAGALSLGLAMEKTGLAAHMAHGLLAMLDGADPRWVMAMLFVITALLTELMSNTASAALMTPLAISISLEMGLSPMPFVIAVMLAASSSFMTPIGYQTNTMIYAPGRYKFKDFFRAGWMLSVITAALAIWLIPIVFKF